MSATQSVRIDADLIKRVDQHAALLGYSRNQFCSAAVGQMMHLIDQPPDNRVVPPLCDMADAMRRNRSRKFQGS